MLDNILVLLCHKNHNIYLGHRNENTYLQRVWKHWFLHSKPCYVQLHAVPQFFHLLTPQVPIHLNLIYLFDTSNYWKHHEPGFLHRHKDIHLLLWSKYVLIIQEVWLCCSEPFLTRFLLTNQNTTNYLKDWFWKKDKG